jgi:hypothetical protein
MLTTPAPLHPPRNRIITASGAVLLLLALATASDAQVLYGSLTGNVTDATGGILPGVSVTATNVETGVAKTAVSGGDGAFLFSDLVPGVYDVTFDISGFNKLVQRTVRIDSNTVRRVDARLTVSNLQETVEVVASTVLLQTDRADVHFTQPAREVNDLPLTGSLGRNYQSLMQTIPGAAIQRTEGGQQLGEANSVAGSPQRSISFNVNGVSSWQNQTKIDGSPVQYVWLPTNTAYVPSPEAIEEVSVVTNSYTAEVGTAGGAAINVVVKSGTNNYHGTGWVYDTDSTWRARNLFQATPTNPKNILVQYGANTGGRIVRDKWFYFFNVEKTTQRVGAASNFRSIAPESLRPNAAGSVAFPTPAEGGAIIYDPLSNADPAQRTPFTNNTIPANRIDPAALYLMRRLPGTTRAGFQDNVLTTGATTYDRTNYDLKINYAASKLTAFGRYGNSPHLIDDAYALGEAGGGSAGGGQVGLAPGRTQVLGLGTTYLFNSSLLLDANFGFTHQVLGAEAPDMGVNIGSDADKMNIPGTNGPDRLQGGLPSFQINNWSNLGNDNTGNPFQFRDNQYSFSVSLQQNFRQHVLRVGTEYLDQQLNHFQPQGGNFQTVRGTFRFDGQATMLPGSTPSDVRFNSWAAFLLGLPSEAGKVEQLVNPNSIYMSTYSAYAQDTWQIGSNLTVSLGLRWELQAFPIRPDGKGVNRFEPTDGFVYIGGYGSTPQDTGADPGGLFLPRAGLAYRLGDKTVIRGGYSRSGDPTSYIQLRNAYPTVFAWAMPQVGGNAFIPVTTLRQGIAPPVAPPDVSSGKIPLPSGTGTTTYPKDLDRGAINSFNVTVQRDIRTWLTAQAAYVGTRAIGQMSFVNINAGAPGTGQAGRPLLLQGFTNLNSDINSYSPYGDTVYDGLQTYVRARSRNAQGGIAYTWSKTTNYTDNGGGNAAGAGTPRIQYLPEKERNKGLAGYDRTHNFQAFGVWDLPFERWATAGWRRAVLDGWQINGIWTVMSGTPIYIVQDTPLALNAAGSRQVPDRVRTDVATYSNFRVGRPPVGADPNLYQYFDRSAYQIVNEPRFGNSPRNTLRGPGFWNVDLGLFRTVGLPGSANVQFRAEVLNLFNHANLANPGNNISDANSFGFITATTGVGERNIRFGLRATF